MHEVSKHYLNSGKALYKHYINTERALDKHYLHTDSAVCMHPQLTPDQSPRDAKGSSSDLAAVMARYEDASAHKMHLPSHTGNVSSL